MILSLFSPLANTAFTAPAAGLDCGVWINQTSVSAGSAAQLTWWSSNATQATLTESGSAPYSVPVSGSKTVAPSGTSTYTLNVWDNAGNTKACSVSISVSNGSNLPVCTLSAAPGTHVPGQPVRLIWYTQYATGANLSNYGTIPAAQLASGYADVYPTQSTLYTMTVVNGSGSRTCSTLVTLSNQNPQPAPHATGYVATPQPVIYSPTYYPSSYSYPGYSSYSYPSYGYSGYTYLSNGPYSTAYFDTVDNYLDQVDYNTGGGIYTSGSYPSSYYSSDFTDPSAYYVAPSQSNGLGDYTLTDTFNNFYQVGTPFSDNSSSDWSSYVPSSVPGTTFDNSYDGSYYYGTQAEPQTPSSNPWDYYQGSTDSYPSAGSGMQYSTDYSSGSQDPWWSGNNQWDYNGSNSI